MPVPVALRSKALLCGRSNAGLESSNTAYEMDRLLKFVVRCAGNGLCYELITRSENPIVCVCVYV
jgi:hypothetical protein